MINVLFKLFDFVGEVEIDDVNHRNINLHYLRKNLSIIPQVDTYIFIYIYYIYNINISEIKR